ncbi:hypothetical protein E0Z10_g7971 [Xylaria hypoxylon]|uniref:Uncharacterized protein n=1 Tax=Xylaria hypoxylon TaxID=37992 RepID=A0A4Z0Y9F1_9PEZI|nr:hypothetical protein E0Z10_g7971 [Xylaria hypoxylon]
MQSTPPPNLPPPMLPPRPLPIYKTLPDASKASLPPKPLITPLGLSPTNFHFPRATLPLSPSVSLSPSPTPTPMQPNWGQKRKWLYSTDSVPVPLQTNPTPRSTGDVQFGGRKHDGAGECEAAERAVKARRMNPSSSNSSHKTNQSPNGRNMYQEPKKISRLEALQIELHLIHNKLLGGATTLTARDQNFLKRQVDDNPAGISALMMNLIIKQVTNKTHNLSYGIMHWAHLRREPQLLEDLLMDRLYNFDVKEAFYEGLMSVREVSDLMDCQTVLQCVRNERTQQARREKVKYADIDVDEDQCESDTGSLDMDLSDDD